MITTAQETMLANALKAETNPSVVAAMAIRDDVTLVNWCNSNSATDAWKSAMESKELFESMDITKFDGLTAGKRDAWRVMLDFGPVDFSKQKNRKAVQDVWGTTDSVAILTDCTRKALNVEKYLGGTSATTNTVTALKLDYTGNISITEVSLALNRNP